MAIDVAKIEIKSVSDASGLEALIASGRMAADSVVAAIGKTEGNGGVNDFTRILSDTAFRGVLLKHGTRSEKEVGAIPMVWSGGCDGVLTPHATVFARHEEAGPTDAPRLAMGTAMSAPILPEDIGRPAMVATIAAGVRVAMADAGIDDPADVHYVQTKTPLLTIDTVREAHERGESAACEVHESMGVSNGTTGLGIAVALGEAGMPGADEICRNLDLYSAVASCSSGVELERGQIVLFGNAAGAGGRFRIGHGVMQDALGHRWHLRRHPQRRPRLAGETASRRSRRPARQLLHQVRGRPQRPAARPAPDHAGRFRRPPSPPFQGCGGRRRGGGNRRPRGVRFGRCHAPGAAGRRPGGGNRRYRLLERVRPGRTLFISLRRRALAPLAWLTRLAARRRGRAGRAARRGPVPFTSHTWEVAAGDRPP